MATKIKLKNGVLESVTKSLGKEEMLCKELDRKNIQCCGISEHRWSGQGEYSHGDHLFVFSGPAPDSDGRKRRGVAVELCLTVG